MSNLFNDAPPLLPETSVVVDLRAVAHNVRVLKGLLSSGTKLMGVVKADAYGHGAVPVAQTLLDNGAQWLAVVRISEAVELRKAGINAPILLFGDVLPEHIPFIAENDIRVTITCFETARILAQVARGQGKKLKVHIKVDTGMGRLGFLHDGLATPKPFNSPEPTGKDDSAPLECCEEILAIQGLKEIEIEGIYTHLASADAKDKAHAQGQLSRFKSIVATLSQKGLTPPIIHAANSAAVMEMPESHFNMVRPGIALYGLWPSEEVDHTRIHLKPAMSIRSKIIHLKQVPKGFKISYGSTHVTGIPTRIATIPIGYADGYNRTLSSLGEMIVKGYRAQITGKVCMDFTMIDVGHIPGVALGDEVVILGSQGKEKITATDIANKTGTINYEVVAGLTRRMPICYIHPGEK